SEDLSPPVAAKSPSSTSPHYATPPNDPSPAQTSQPPPQTAHPRRPNARLLPRRNCSRSPSLNDSDRTRSGGPAPSSHQIWRTSRRSSDLAAGWFDGVKFEDCHLGWRRRESNGFQ